MLGELLLVLGGFLAIVQLIAAGRRHLDLLCLEGKEPMGSTKGPAPMRPEQVIRPLPPMALMQRTPLIHADFEERDLPMSQQPFCPKCGRLLTQYEWRKPYPVYITETRSEKSGAVLLWHAWCLMTHELNGGALYSEPLIELEKKRKANRKTARRRRWHRRWNLLARIARRVLVSVFDLEPAVIYETPESQDLECQQAAEAAGERWAETVETEMVETEISALLPIEFFGLGDPLYRGKVTISVPISDGETVHFSDVQITGTQISWPGFSASTKL